MLTWFLPMLVCGTEPSTKINQNWPQWRGPHANGIASHGNPPLEWSESNNIKWKIKIPGEGHATPIIWENQLFLLAAVQTKKKVDPDSGKQTKANTGYIPFNKGTKNLQRYVIISFDRSDGHIIWQQTAREELPHEGTSIYATWASNSPVTDGQHIYAYFGSKGLYCYDMAGNLQWETDLGDMEVMNKWGEGSSPVLYEDKIIINWDHEGQSFIIALNKHTGKEVWKTFRDEVTSWSTPFVIEHEGQVQIITTAPNRIRSYAADTGELLWEDKGLIAPEVIPTPVSEEGLLYVMCGGTSRASELRAIDLALATGDISDSRALVWSMKKETPYIPSPLLYENQLYLVKRTNGILASLDPKTGQAYYSGQRLKGIGDMYASPIAVAGHIYISSLNGSTQVVKHGQKYESVALNKLDDRFSASPVVVGNDLYLRGKKYLYCISDIDQP